MSVTQLADNITESVHKWAAEMVLSEDDVEIAVYITLANYLGKHVAKDRREAYLARILTYADAVESFIKKENDGGWKH